MWGYRTTSKQPLKVKREHSSCCFVWNPMKDHMHPIGLNVPTYNSIYRTLNFSSNGNFITSYVKDKLVVCSRFSTANCFLFIFQIISSYLACSSSMWRTSCFLLCLWSQSVSFDPGNLVGADHNHPNALQRSLGLLQLPHRPKKARSPMDHAKLVVWSLDFATLGLLYAGTSAIGSPQVLKRAYLKD